MKHFTVSWWDLGQGLVNARKNRTIHFFKLGKNVALVWDRKDGK